jgi:DNA-binding Xre family transcriptional regulator
VFPESSRKWLLQLLQGPEFLGNQSELARVLGTKQSWISKLETGEQKGDLRLSMVQRLADRLDCQPSDLIWAMENGVDPPRRGIRGRVRQP